MTDTAHADTAPHDAPDLDTVVPDGRTPYVAYTEVDVLRASVHPQTDEPLEVTFVVVTQIMELHFLLIEHEWRLAIAALGNDDVATATRALRRSVANQGSLLEAWQMLDPMSPVEYARFRDNLGQASGFQSYGYRMLEFMVGVRDANLIRPNRGMPQVAAALQAAFDSPSLFDVATDVVRRRSGRDDVVDAWLAAYDDPELTELAEVLAAVSDRHSRWRFVHYQAVRRILGDRTGTAGSAGLKWLKRAVDSPVFPELWEVRARI